MLHRCNSLYPLTGDSCLTCWGACFDQYHWQGKNQAVTPQANHATFCKLETSSLKIAPAASCPGLPVTWLKPATARATAVMILCPLPHGDFETWRLFLHYGAILHPTLPDRHLRRPPISKVIFCIPHNVSAPGLGNRRNGAEKPPDSYRQRCYHF
ncbi:hypothetical protein CEXT_487631 [Caerostris extrusa]|uniref:Uncharacterized protein n=1 Tax=Caerostris extrusa TaxID=172846 RepID=A0AAV4Q3D5_CAEEX|nr:hypothetical protein CEXT_487631 [Caerostris extrusa]